MKDPLYFLKKKVKVKEQSVKLPLISTEYLNIYSLLLASCDLIYTTNIWVNEYGIKVYPHDFLKNFINKKCVVGILVTKLGIIYDILRLLKTYDCQYTFFVAEDVYPASHFIKRDPSFLNKADKIYIKNIDFSHTKIIGFPLGCCFWLDRLTPIENLREKCIDKTNIMKRINNSNITRKNKIFNDYTTTAYGKNWHVGDFNIRKKCLEFMKKHSEKFEKSGIEIDIVETRITQEDSWKRYRESKFVLSPPGNGYDCHRHFEAIVLGAIPIFIRTPFMTSTVYHGFPYIELNSIEELTPELLNNYEYKEFNKQMLETKYWVDKIRDS